MEVTYTVVQLDSIPSGRYTEVDSRLINSFELNSSFDTAKHFIQAFYYVEDQILSSNTDYLNYKIHSDSGIAGSSNASRVVIDPVEDVKALDYRVPQIESVYNFYSNLFSPAPKVRPKFFIEQISEDGLELLLVTTDLSSAQITETVTNIQDRLKSEQNFLDFTLLFENSVEVVAIAISTLDYKNTKAVVVKLYQEQPASIQLKNTLEIVEVVSNPAVFLVSSTVTEATPSAKRLAEPNFNLEGINESSLPTSYLNYNELLSIDTTYNSNLSELLSRTSEKSIEVNIDYSQFSNFVNYSSAVERLANFKYKLALIENYQNSLTQLANTPSATVSKKKLEDLIQGIVRNLDHYERFLYFEKSDYSWPKTGTNKPYTLLATTNGTAQTWYNSKVVEAEQYDISNYNALVNTVPLYLREDSQNNSYLVFINMIGHHFDNLWIYAKAVSSKYNADNRLNSGISKDLVEEVLKNFGVKLYSSTKSIEDLFRYFTLDTYDTQQEVINSNITVQSLQTSQKDYQKEVYKRIYHNLPLLLKSKGTERAIKVLITSFGIPTDLIPVKTYGGVDRNQTPYLAQQTVQSGSYDKIRIPTASLGVNNTLSYYADTLDITSEYTKDLHRVEVGYSPTDNIDSYILSQIDSQFNIDNYLGNPREVDYTGLKTTAKSILGSLTKYNLKDFVRLIKFFDNRLFKMVKDFLPARSVVDTGIIVKPHLLERSKGLTVTVQTTDSSVLTSSIDTAFIEGSDSSVFGAKSDYITSYTSSVQTPIGIVDRPANPNGIKLVARTDGETPRYTGEFSGSTLEITNGELNSNNSFKKLQRRSTPYDLILKSQGTCQLTGGSTVYIRNQGPYNITAAPFFANTTDYTTYTGKNGITINSPTNFTLTPLVAPTNYTQGEVFNLVASRNGGSCVGTTPVEIAYCLLELSPTRATEVSVNSTYNITQWFSPHPVHSGDTFQYIIKTNDNQTFTLNSTAASNYTFSSGSYTAASTPITVTQKIPALDNKPAGTECRIDTVLAVTFGCSLVLTSIGRSTRRSINEGDTITEEIVLQSFDGAIEGFTTYNYNTTVLAGGEGTPETGLLGTHPTITPVTASAADCLFISASNGAGCQAVTRIGINRVANQGIIYAAESFGSSFVNGLPVTYIIAQYYNPSGIATEALIRPENWETLITVHPTKTFTDPDIAGARVWYRYYNNLNEVLSEANPPVEGLPFITRPAESISTAISYALSACSS